MTTDFYLRILQALSLAPGAAVLATNDLHGVATAPLARLGIPGWFIRWVGLWKGMIIMLNFLHEGEYIPLSQSMMSMLMGGAVYTHAVIERSTIRCVPALLFLGTSAAVPILRGASRPLLSASISLMLGVTGCMIGHGVQLGLQTPAPSKREGR